MEITIEGIEETMAALDRLPAFIVELAFLKAARAAAQPIEAGLDYRCPEKTGRLRASRVTNIELDSGLRGVSVEIGYGKMGHVANFIEYGHEIVGHKPKKKDTGRRVSPKAFMRITTEVAGEVAIDAFAEELAIDIRGLSLADVA